MAGGRFFSALAGGLLSPELVTNLGFLQTQTEAIAPHKDFSPEGPAGGLEPGSVPERPGTFPRPCLCRSGARPAGTNTRSSGRASARTCSNLAFFCWRMKLSGSKPRGQRGYLGRDSFLQKKLQTSLRGFLAALIRIKDRTRFSRISPNRANWAEVKAVPKEATTFRNPSRSRREDPYTLPRSMPMPLPG